MSSRQKFLYATALSIMALIVISQFAAATQRKDLLTQYVVNNQLSGGGFTDTINSSVVDNIEFSSYSAIWILSQTGALGQINNATNVGYFQSEFLGSSLQTDLENLYYVYEGLTLLGGSLNANNISSTATNIQNLEDSISYGFKTLSNPIPTLSATYFAVALLKAMGQLSAISSSNVVTYVESNWNATFGAFVNSNESTTASPIDSYYALMTLQALGQLGNFTTHNQALLTNYIDSFYCNNTIYPDMIGGYTYSQTDPYSSIVLTDVCVSILTLIKAPLNSAQTITWLIARQSPADYGFQDIQENNQNAGSSVIASYYALQALLVLDPNILTDQMSQDIWQLSTNPWIIAAIVIGCVAGVVLLFFGIWKLKNRM